MSDESRIAAGGTVRVTLLTGHILNHLHATRPEGAGCAACRRPWAVHPDDHQRYPCERCGVWLESECYRRFVVSAGTEWRRWTDNEDEGEGLIFLCQGCRQ